MDRIDNSHDLRSGLSFSGIKMDSFLRTSPKNKLTLHPFDEIGSQNAIFATDPGFAIRH